LHDKSQRSNRPFIAINCSALPQNLLESELFGHKKGAFTGAVQDKIGLFEEAEGGTVFLDEINSMAPLLQTKLLRVLQERVIRRVGDNHSIPIHVRVLAATNEPLHEKIKTGEFRQDLYYRLAVIPVEMPALRERSEDIPLLVDYFLSKHARQDAAAHPLAVETAAINALRAYQWPGNVRELENAIERACVLSENGVVRLQDLPPHVQPSQPSIHSSLVAEQSPLSKTKSPDLPIGQSLHDFISGLEHRFIEETIRFNQGSRERAAHMLGISTATLYRKMEHERKSHSAD
jgi:transcriptional regulator with PAS, ATPase and Fis domain